MPFLHHIPNKPKPKFASPRKRASKLYNELQNEAIQTSIKSKPNVFGSPFRVGDAIELEVAFEGFVHIPTKEYNYEILRLLLSCTLLGRA